MLKFRRITSMITTWSFVLLMLISACKDSASDNGPNIPQEEVNLSEQNLLRAMELADKAVSSHFTGDGMAMARYYNPFTEVRSEEKGSVWMYTSAIEAVNAILHALKVQKEQGDPALYNEHFNRYSELLHKLYDNADYYLGTFRLVSYTQTKEWSVYGVNRGGSKGSAKVEGIENVYDDQMWLIRELLESYKLTDNAEYLEKAEYLTAYVLDGWDCTRDGSGEERGGIPWGPGYVTKHACSNGPMVSPLVWLHELYKDKSDEVTYRYIDATDKQTRIATQVKKSDYYLDFARKIYAWQKSHLLRSDGVYDDMRGGCSPGSPELHTVDGTVYRKGTTCVDRVGPAITYNSGTMLSGGADLYRATQENTYLEDAKTLSDDSFQYFAKLGETKPGYYTYDISGFRNWFNGVLMRGYVDVYPAYEPAADYISSFQQNLDHGYDNFLYNGFLPTNLLVGWSRDNSNNRTEGMFSFAYAAQYAVLARYEMEKH
ncbi:glycoside hydrolase family 76 protein [Cesiribacter sp. SM1]|uniref:glycoside hydrolase family 76 protein n=1 Tax=Cesiribacter sp. SM1 TaxID=2861196 RepID=UPI001CD31C9C|nr:glycoside hydrolase family 76 protein [Cesiribacter sp. SM1]